VNEDTIRRYKSGLADEIEPAIAQLIELAEQGLNALEKQEQALQTKVTSDGFFFLSLVFLRHQLQIDSAKSRRPNASTGTSAVQKLEARRLQTLIRQREKLEEEVRALEDELLQSVR
jgi:DASH complex subunit SPC19